MLYCEVKHAIHVGQKGYLACFPVHSLSLKTLIVHLDNEKEMVSWPTYKERWRFVIEAISTQKKVQ